MDLTDSQANASNESLEAENARLRSRIRELQSELGERRETESGSTRRSRTRRTRRISEETEDSLRDIPDHAMDELDRLARGFSYAAAEHFRSASDVINRFADEMFRGRPERRSESETRRESESDLDREEDRLVDYTDDTLAGIAGGVHESIEMPRRVIERFFDAYEEDLPARSSRRRTRARTGRSVRTRAEARDDTTRGSDSPIIQP